MMTFQEWLAIREGLWLNDDKAVEGLSKLTQPKPKKPPQSQANFAGREAGQATGASRAAEVFNSTRKKGTTIRTPA